MHQGITFNLVVLGVQLQLVTIRRQAEALMLLPHWAVYSIDLLGAFRELGKAYIEKQSKVAILKQF